MNITALIVGIIMMSLLPLTKFMKTGGILLILSIPCFIGGLIALIVGVASKFTNVQKISNINKNKEE
jgi:hypothetical protein